MPRYLLAVDQIAILLTMGFVLQMLAAYPSLAGLRSSFVFAGAVCIAVAFGFLPNVLQTLGQALRALPTIPALLYLGWTFGLCFFAPYPDFARAETLRVACGAAAYLLLVGHRPAARRIPALLIACGIVQCVYDLYRIGQRGGIHNGSDYSAFATHQEVGSLLLILLPFCVAFGLQVKSLSDSSLRRYHLRCLFAVGATLLILVALLISRSRSAWLGGGVTLLVSFGLAGWYTWRSRPTHHSETPPRVWLTGAIIPVFTVLAVAVFFGVTQGGQVVINRGTSLFHWQKDLAMQDRFRYWKAGFEMAREKPLTGWGPGSYIVIQRYWTGIGRTEKQVLLSGASHSNIAHSYYAQWAADTGFIGLGIHGLLLCSFGIAGARCLHRYSKKKVPIIYVIPLIAGMATIAGTAIDAIASPSYNFHAISLLWWIALGVATDAHVLYQDLMDGTTKSISVENNIPTKVPVLILYR